MAVDEKSGRDKYHVFYKDCRRRILAKKFRLISRSGKTIVEPVKSATREKAERR